MLGLLREGKTVRPLPEGRGGARPVGLGLAAVARYLAAWVLGLAAAGRYSPRTTDYGASVLVGVDLQMRM